jgi:hypothetical protein
MKNNLTDEEMLIVLESAWFSFCHNYEDLAEYLDLSDEELQPIKQKLDSLLGE